VFVGAIPGALPPLIGYIAAIGGQSEVGYVPVDYQIAIILFLIQFVWQFPHFWAIAWVLDDDYQKGRFQACCLLKREIKPVRLLPLSSTVVLNSGKLVANAILGFGGFYIAGVSVLAGLYFSSYYAYQVDGKDLDLPSARKVMFCSFFYIPLVQLILLFDLVV
jgi:protoheme IX farnesyltransferase